MTVVLTAFRLTFHKLTPVKTLAVSKDRRRTQQGRDGTLKLSQAQLRRSIKEHEPTIWSVVSFLKLTTPYFRRLTNP